MKNKATLLLCLLIAAHGAFCQSGATANDDEPAYSVTELKSLLKKTNDAISAEPANSDYYSTRGDVKKKLNDLPGALADYDQAITLKKDNTEALINRGVLRRDLGNVKGAMNDFEAAIRYNRRMPEGYNNKAFLLYSTGRAKESIPYFDTALVLKPDYRNAYNNKIEALIVLKRYSEAATACQLLMAHFPNHPVSYIHRADLYKAEGQLIPALEDYDKAVQLSNYKPDIVLIRALFKDDGLNDHKGAIEDCNRVIASNPELSDGWYYRARAEYSLEQYDRTIEDCDKAIALSPRQAGIYVFRGNAWDLGGDRPRALKDYDTALSINPKMSEAYTEKSSSLLLMGDSVTALKVLDAYSTFNDTPHAMIFLRRGVLKVAYHQYAGAKKDLEQVIALRPDDVAPYYWSALANDSLHNRAGACAMMIKAWRLGGIDTPFVYVQKFCRRYASASEVEAQEQMLQSRDNQARRNFSAAMANCDRVIALMPDSAVAYYNRGKLKRMMENHTGAIADYLKAIKLNPAMTPAYVAAAVSYYYLGDKKSARDYYAGAIKSDPNNAMSYYNLGVMAREENNCKEATGLFRKAVNCQYNYPKAWAYLGDCYNEAGDKQNACFCYAQAEGLGDVFSGVQRKNLCK